MVGSARGWGRLRLYIDERIRRPCPCVSSHGPAMPIPQDAAVTERQRRSDLVIPFDQQVYTLSSVTYRVYFTRFSLPSAAHCAVAGQDRERGGR